MIKVFTPNDVIGFVYGEKISPSDSKHLELAIIKDDVLADVFYQSHIVKDILSKVSFEPSSRVIDNILSYSRSYLID